jgi:signal transduction histidine kinase
LRASPSLNGVITVDRDRLGEVIDNLIANALDVVANGGKVVVEAERADGPSQLVIRVKDSGGGVPLSMRDRLFEPFATTKESGMGLGLFLSAEIVRGLGGVISYHEVADVLAVNGQPNPSDSVGACFEVRMPC